MSTVSQNLIWANYGSSQGFDTDDGSSWYNISNNFMYQADGYKMDFGGHDTIVTDNIFYKFKGDGQNCINTWPFLYKHGTTYSGNKCILPESHSIGSTNGCRCPGPEDSKDPSASHCGVQSSHNEYYGFKANLTVSCEGGDPLSFTDYQAKGSDKGSKAFNLPSDDLLVYWVRAKLGMTMPPGPKPDPPPPLPPAPPAHWPDTCEGDCHRNHMCCNSPDKSGCSKPTCVMGCEIAKVMLPATLNNCIATCKKAEGQCKYSLLPYKNVTFNQCVSCTNDDQCLPQGGCDPDGACEKGCAFQFNRTTGLV